MQIARPRIGDTFFGHLILREERPRASLTPALRPLREVHHSPHSTQAKGDVLQDYPSLPYAALCGQQQKMRNVTCPLPGLTRGLLLSRKNGGPEGGRGRQAKLNLR